MGERLIPAVLKTVVPERVPGVRIPLPPPSLTLIGLCVRLDSLDLDVCQPHGSHLQAMYPHLATDVPTDVPARAIGFHSIPMDAIKQ